MLDLRLPVGIFFLLIGAILFGDGLLHPAHSPGTTIILGRDWGAFLLVFGALMAFFGARAKPAEPEPPAPPDTP